MADHSPGRIAPFRRLRQIEARHSAGAERPLGGYGMLMSGYTALVAGLIAAGRARRVRLPARIAAPDLALLTVATYRASRLVTKDSVTAVARAPFTTFEAPAGRGEVHEEVIGTGPRHAVGELVSCPFCASVWLATIGTFGLLAFPEATRTVCSVLTAVTGADALQFAFSGLERLEPGGPPAAGGDDS